MQIPCAIASPKVALNKSNWKIRKQSIEMVRSSSGHIHMSSNCLTNKKCQALMAQKKAAQVKFSAIDFALNWEEWTSREPTNLGL